MVWALIEGKVVSVTDGNKITIVLKDKRRKQVRLVGIDAPKPGHIFGEESRRMLSGLVLNQEVEVIADFHSDKSEELTGIIHVKAKDVNLALIEAGLARYQEPVAYSMSNYTACTYRIVEGEARAAKRGLWQNVSR
jgi:endonuclease YncB( thermonuclease family)